MKTLKRKNILYEKTYPESNDSKFLVGPDPDCGSEISGYAPIPEAIQVSSENISPKYILVRNIKNDVYIYHNLYDNDVDE